MSLEKKMSTEKEKVTAPIKEGLYSVTAPVKEGLYSAHVATAIIPDKRDALQKKSSSADLMSRLKSRKLLGVGATDDGDIHRSKLSQILGHNEPMLAASREPIKWLLKWNGILSAILIISAFWSLILPSMYSEAVLGGTHSVNLFYSTGLLCMSLPLVSMSRRLVENSTQTSTLIAIEIYLLVHIVGALYGGAIRAMMTILVITIINSTFLLLMCIENPNKLVNMFRRLSQSREGGASYADKKSN